MDDRTIETTARDLALRLFAAIGLGVSSLLLVQYLSPEHSLCTHGGCASVRQSAYAYPGGIPTPVFGIAYFLAVIALSLAPLRNQRKLVLSLTAVGAAAALGFVALQATAIGAWCEYCLAADGTALIVFGLAVSLIKVPRPEVGKKQWVIFGVIAASAVSLGVTAPMMTRTAPYQKGMPPEIRALQVDGKVTVVEFMDFGCPACKAQHARFTRAFGDQRSSINMVYKHVPLSMHRGAKDAARAYLCAGDTATAKKMADDFFAAEELSPAIARRIAEKHGVEMAAFDTCVASDETRTRLESDHNLAGELGVRGLPTFWIGDERYVGVQPPEVIRDAIERAKSASGL
jgi:protein-disulfide isomerase